MTATWISRWAHGVIT